MPTEEPVTPQSDQELLPESRDRYKYFSAKWRPIREERRIDMRYICGQPWSEEDLKERKDAGRPAINHDELGQYIAQSMGNIRANKRGIKVEPGGGGSSDETAEF